MPELRTDWLTGRTVLVAENRALRPDDFSTAHSASPFSGEPVSAGGSHASNCPFCAGSEARTPPAVYEKLDADANWLVRVVPNAYPALDPWNDLGTPQPSTFAGTHGAASIEAASPIAGAHEVIIESPAHVENMAELSAAQLREALEACVARLRFWRSTAGIRYGLVFKNQGPRAGASLAHVHSQLIALPFVPTSVSAELDRAAQRYRETGTCAYCDRIDEERRAGARIVFETDGIMAFCPFVSWQPHEVWLMPTGHEASFDLQSRDGLDRTGRALHLLISRLEAVVPGAHYNMLLRTSPFTGDYATAHHWRIELLPRANSLAGLEVATGIHINPLPPERASSQLRLR